MIVLKATPEQYEQLNGLQDGVDRLEFAKDANDDWIVGLQVLDNPAFSEIHDQLDSLERVEFEPMEPEL